MSRKYEKQPFRALGLIKNENFHTSEPSDEQKLLKTDFPSPRKAKNASKTVGRRPTKHRITQKPPVVPLRRAKNGKNRPSYPYEEQKTAKTALRTPTMNRKTEKTAFHPRMTNEKQQILRFIHG